MAKATYERRKQMGLCVHCGNEPPLPGLVRCGTCHNKALSDGRIQKKERRITAKANGVCVLCEKRQATIGYRCETCAAWHSNYTRKLRSSKPIGICREGNCQNKSEPDRKLCKQCLTRARERIKNLPPGVCRTCRGDSGTTTICKRCLEKRRQRRQYIKYLAFMAYGGLICKCCGETIKEFLTIDHIHGGGNKHRKELKNKSHSFYMWLRKNNYPDGYQVLCINCNCGRYNNGGICPHKTNRLPEYII